ncbi:hypothetical protein FA95DRAFT_1581239 [Auriscalpium vulgare]|uniref:Uncharacterized protein n=1 Tax=Auriscalpium vulgare TaxID=40419 RepID=A0ACB8S3F7_9AGAM|nr:hypothetical protein FA95DRAFT_1581239 [Auriscalpium vulgare]
MFSFRRKPTKKNSDESVIRASPSLPELSTQGIPWPENLVDIAAIRQTPPPEPRFQGAARTSFHSPDRPPIPFHKPFRGVPGQSTSAGAANGKIHSLYMSNGPAAFEALRTAAASPHPTARPSQRRARIPPKFNLMVAGGRGTGKTSLLRLLLDTADISPTATSEHKASLERFMRGSVKHTEAIQTASAEICESRFDRVLLSVVDTPGLDFHEGRELKLERQVSSVVKYLDSQFSDTMSEESKVVRQSKGDQHIHLCIYIIDPASIKTPAARRQLSSLPTKTRSETTISYRNADDTPPLTDDSHDSDDDDDDEGQLSMTPAELRVMRRLATRVNILPVIGLADSLTDDKLEAVKATVRRELRQAQLNLGVFGPTRPSVPDVPKIEEASAEVEGDSAAGSERPSGNHEEEAPGPAAPSPTDAATPTDSAPGDSSTPPAAPPTANGEHEPTPAPERPTRASRPVIKLRTNRGGSVRRSRSRGRLDLERDEREPVTPDPADAESVANARFSAALVARTDLSGVLPFAIIAPQETRARRARAKAQAQQAAVVADAVDPSEDGHAVSMIDSPVTPSHPLRNSSFLHGPPEDLKGVFVRKFRWGTVDVLNPSHCDFAALRTAVLSTHMKVLKTHTREVLYERFRTEKLLARRVTQKIGEEETKRLLEDLGL